MVAEPVERIRTRRHQWPATPGHTCPFVGYNPPPPPMSTPAPSHTPYPSVTPSRKSAVPKLVRHPTPFALLTDLLCAEDELGVGWGNRAPSLAEPPNPANPTGLRSLDRVGKRCEPGKIRKRSAKGFGGSTQSGKGT
jgi:hypothetical protein